MNRFLLALAALTILITNSSAQAPNEQVLQATNVEFLNKLAAEQNAIALEQFRIAVEKATREGWPIRTESADGEIIMLIRLDEGGAPVYMKTDNTTSQAIINTDDLQIGPYNLNGTGIVIREWDGGNIRATHENLTPPARVTNLDAAGLSDHATHVAGTMIGDGSGNATAEGMAPAATIRGFDFFNDQSEMATEAAAGAIMSNHSYGFVSGWYFDGANWHWYGDPTINTNESHHFGWYSATTAAYDVIAYNAPFYLMVKSSGNDHGDNGTNPHSHNGAGSFSDFHPADCNSGVGYDCLEFFGSAKNDLTVGAIDDASAMSSFSSWGPTDDGRIGVDIVANGVSLTSSIASADNAYASMSGTSMSAPSVTGSIALLQQHHKNLNAGANMRSATVKALVCHTADDLGNPGPDYVFGYGRMNSLRAAQVIDANAVNTVVMQENTLTNFGTFNQTVFATGGGTPLQVTICWTDPAGTGEAPGHDIPTIKLINDLDIRITDGITTWFPYVLDASNPANSATQGDNIRDNMEKLFIPAPLAGDSYTITVTHKGSLVSPQAYSLIITGINLGCTPPTVNAGIDRSICLGSSVVIGGTPTATGGIAPYTYVWAPSAGLSSAFVSNPNASPASTTTYTVTVTDAAGCSAFDAVLVTVNPVPTANAGADRAICAGQSSVIGGSPTASGGTPGYTYAWLPAAGLSSTTVANPTATPAATTDYTVTVTDVNTCQATDIVVVTVRPMPTVSAGPDRTVCDNSQPIAIGGTPTATGGTAPYTYSWVPTTGLSASNVPNPDATRTPGVYTYTVTVTDAFGCGGPDAMVLTVNANPDPIITANPNDTICYGATTQLCATNVIASTTQTYNISQAALINMANNCGGGSYYSPCNGTPIGFSWTDIGTGSILNVQVQFSIGVECAAAAHTTTFNGSFAGPSYTTAAWCNCAFNSQLFTLNFVPTNYVVGGVNTFMTSAASCFGMIPSAALGNFYARVVVTFAGDNLLWSTGATTQCINVAPTTTTNYWVTATKAGTGCQGFDTMQVYVWPQLFADAGPDEEYCENSGTIVNIGGLPTGSGGMPGYTYSWSPTTNLSCTTCANPDANPNVTTTYNVIVTDSEGCSVSDAVTVVVNLLPVPTIDIDLGADSICYGDSLRLCVDVKGGGPGGSLSPGAPTVAYTWGGNMFNLTTFGSGLLIDSFDIHAYNGSGTVEVWYKAGTYVGFETNAGAWTLLGSSFVVPNGLGVMTPLPIGGITIPAGQTYGFYITSVVNGSPGLVFPLTGGPRITTNADLQIWANNATGLPQFTAFSNGYNWDGRVYYSTPPVQPISILWSTGETTTCIEREQFASEQFWVQVTDGNGCVNYDTLDIWVDQEIILDAPDVSICLWDAVILGGSPTASGGVGGFSYQWSPPTNLSCVNCPNPIANPAFTTTYTVDVTDAFGCMEVEQVTVTVNPNPEADAGPFQAICPSDVVTIGGSPTGLNGTPPYTYLWSPATGLNNTTISNPDASPPATTWYTITVSDANGCNDVDSVRVVVYPLPDATILTPGPYCFNDGIQQLMAATNGGTWSGPGIINPATGDFDPAIAGPGIHQVVYEIVSFVGCYNSDTAMIEVFALTPVAITSGIDFCTNQGNVFLTATPLGGTWNGSGIVNSSTGEFDPLAAGLGTHQIFYSFTDANGCTNVDTADVTVHSAPDPTITPVGPFCENVAPIQLVAASTGGTWSGAGTSSTGLFDPGAAGPGIHIIVYDITDANGCMNSDTITITVLSAPSVAINSSSPFCENTTNVTLVGTPAAGTSYWSGPGIINPLTGEWSPSSAGPGTHTITLTKTYANGCVSAASTIIVVFAAPDPSINPVGPQCFDGSPITLTAATSGGQWSGNGITNSSAGTFDPLVAGPGTHTITYVVTNINGCSDQDTVDIIVATEIDIVGSTTDVLCNGDQDGEVDIYVSGGTPPYAYLWSNGAITEDLGDVGAGPYTVTVTDAMACTQTATFIVMEPTAIFVLDTIVLPATSPSFGNGSIDATFSGGTPPYDYVWSNGEITEDIYGLQGDVYRVTVIDANGCRYSFLITVPMSFGLNVDLTTLEDGLRVFPVPTSGLLHIELELTGEADLGLSMFDVLGRQLYTVTDHTNGTFSHTIDMGQWASGNYFVKMQVGDQVVTRAVVLTK